MTVIVELNHMEGADLNENCVGGMVKQKAN